MSTRKELLKMGEDAIKAVKLPFKIRKEKKQLEALILDYEERVATLESEINDLKAEETLNVERILDKVDDLELAQRRLKQGEELMKELFDDAP